MRNLLQYPITLSEVVQCLDTLQAQLNNEENIGDMRPLLLEHASRIVLRAGFAISDVEMPKRRAKHGRA